MNVSSLLIDLIHCLHTGLVLWYVTCTPSCAWRAWSGWLGSSPRARADLSMAKARLLDLRSSPAHARSPPLVSCTCPPSRPAVVSSITSCACPAWYCKARNNRRLAIHDARHGGSQASYCCVPPRHGSYCCMAPSVSFCMLFHPCSIPSGIVQFMSVRVWNASKHSTRVT